MSDCLIMYLYAQLSPAFVLLWIVVLARYPLLSDSHSRGQVHLVHLRWERTFGSGVLF